MLRNLEIDNVGENMNNELIKKRVINLFEEMFNTTMSDSRQQDIGDELDNLLPDPYWSDYIFWSEDYLNADESINYDKFFDKVFDYPNSEEYKRNERIINLANALLKRDFAEQSEMDIVNEINELSPDIHWMQYLFVDKSCLNADGSLNEKLFLDKLFNK